VWRKGGGLSLGAGWKGSGQFHPDHTPRPARFALPATPELAVEPEARAERGKVVGPWRDNRHTLVTELAESGAGDEVIMSIAGHVSRQMLSRYSHIRTEAKRDALEAVDRKRATVREQRKEAEAQAPAVPATLQ